MEKNNKKILALTGILLIIVLIVVIVVYRDNKQATVSTGEQTVMPGQEETAPEEIAPSKSIIPTTGITPEIVKESKQIAVGASLVTKDNVVITPEGAPVKLNVMPASSEAPRESAPIADSAQIKDDAYTVKISVSATGFTPNLFTVKEGQLVNFVLTSADDFTHVWLPDDPALTATALGVAGHETRVKSWNAPKKGTYTFRCDIPGHKDRGEVGQMIVE